MTKVITLHSTRGGVGKTLIATNLAMAYASQGKDVCLIDLDFRAPSISKILQLQHSGPWMNDFLDGHGEILKVLVDRSSKYNTAGKLLVGLAAPSLASIRNMVSKDRRWEMQALRRLISMKRELTDRGVEYVIFDTSPGILYSSVNAVACSDLVVVVTTADILNARETQWVITELYEAFEKKTCILINKALPAFHYDEKEMKKVLERFTPMFTTPIMSVIPCFCSLLNSRKVIFTIEMPEHPFSKAIYETAEKLSMIGD